MPAHLPSEPSAQSVLHNLHSVQMQWTIRMLLRVSVHFSIQRDPTCSMLVSTYGSFCLVLGAELSSATSKPFDASDMLSKQEVVDVPGSDQHFDLAQHIVEASGPHPNASLVVRMTGHLQAALSCSACKSGPCPLISGTWTKAARSALRYLYQTHEWRIFEVWTPCTHTLGTLWPTGP